MPEDEVEGPMQDGPAVKDLESEVDTAAKEVEAAATNVNELRAQRRIASASLRQVGISIPASQGGKSVDRVVEEYENIVVEGENFKTIQRWVARLRGRTPEVVIEEYNRESERLITEFDGTVHQAYGELYAMREKLNSINTKYEDVRTRTKNHLDIAKQYRVNIERVNASLSGFRSLDPQKKGQLFDEFAPGLKNDRRYVDDARDLKLMQVLRGERNRLGLELNSTELETRQLHAKAVQLTHQYRTKERHIEDYEARISAAELNFEPVRQYILSSMIAVEPRGSGVAQATVVIDQCVAKLQKQAEKKAPYVAMQEQRRIDEEVRGMNPLPDMPDFEQYHDSAYNGKMLSEGGKLRDSQDQELAAMDETLYTN